MSDQFTGWAQDYYVAIGELKAKRARGERLTGIEELTLTRAEVRNI